MNIDKFMDLPIDFVMKLYREKNRAEKELDEVALLNMHKNYPELFSDEFKDFINDLKAIASGFELHYGEGFSSMFKDDESINAKLN